MRSHVAQVKNQSGNVWKATPSSAPISPPCRQQFLLVSCVFLQENFVHMQAIQGHILPLFKKQIIAYYTLCFAPCFFHSIIYLGKLSIWIYKEHLDPFLQLQNFPLCAWNGNLFSWSSHDGHLDGFQYFASPSLGPGNHHPTFLLYEFDHSRDLIWVEPYHIVLLCLVYFISMMSSRFFHVGAGVKISFLFKAEEHCTVCIDRILFTHSSMDRLLSSLVLVNNATMNTRVQIHVQGPDYSILGKYSEEKLLHNLVILCLSFWGTSVLFSQWLRHFTLLQIVPEGSNFSTSSPILVIFWFLVITILLGVKWYLIMINV